MIRQSVNDCPKCADGDFNVMLQGRTVSAIVLSVLHVLAYYVGDAIIMAEVRLVAYEPQGAP